MAVNVNINMSPHLRRFLIYPYLIAKHGWHLHLIVVRTKVELTVIPVLLLVTMAALMSHMYHDYTH